MKNKETVIHYEGFSMRILCESYRLEENKLICRVWYQITAPFLGGADYFGFVRDAINEIGLKVSFRNEKMILFQEDLNGFVQNARKLLRTRLKMIFWLQQKFWYKYENPQNEMD